MDEMEHRGNAELMLVDDSSPFEKDQGRPRLRSAGRPRRQPRTTGNKPLVEKEQKLRMRSVTETPFSM